MKKLLAVIGILLLSSNGYAGEVTGSVKFSGTAPVREPLSMGADPTCAGLHPEAPLSEEVIVNGNGTLKNVFVYVKDAALTSAAPTTPVTIDQKGCQYTPHVFGMNVGQELEIINSDATLHNIHAMPEKGKQFNLGMPIQGMKLKKKFEAPEVMVKMKCDVHPWMSAYIGVLSHNYFGVSGDDGSFTIKDLPAGEYTVEAWHEKYGPQEQKITVVDGAPVNLEFTFGA